MKKLKLLFLLLPLVLFSACGTETSSLIDPNRGFDMWEYMTSTLNYKVEYDIYVNDTKRDYYSETHKVETNKYVRESSNGVTTLLLNGNKILMQEPLEDDVTIARYVSLGDKGVFESSSINLCTVERFYNTYTNKEQTFHNVLMIGCTTKSGSNQEFYYGYNEGIVSVSEDDGTDKTVKIKVKEESLF